MRVQIVLACSAATLTFGCGTSLKVTVERYEMTEAARQVYEKSHPAAPPALIQMLQLREAVQRYSEQLILLNTTDAQFGSLAKTAPDSCETQRDLVTPRVKSALGPLVEAIDAAIKHLTKLSQGQRAIGLAERVSLWIVIDQAWTAATGRLAQAKLETSPEPLKRKIEQLKNAGGGNSEIEARLAPLIACTTAADVRKAETAIETVVAGGALTSQTAVKASLADLRGATGGDLIERVHLLYQDMSDPFLGYIASNESNWKRLPNEASVNGDGDTEFMLVFEDTLDARWSSVSVDPEKVIRARLRTARSVGGTLAAASGLVAGMYGIPVPAIAGVAGKAEKDFAEMTADTEADQLANDRIERQLRGLASVASSERQRLSAPDVTAADVDASRERLIRALKSTKGASEPKTEGPKGDGS